MAVLSLTISGEVCVYFGSISHALPVSFAGDGALLYSIVSDIEMNSSGSGAVNLRLPHGDTI